MIRAEDLVKKFRYALDTGWGYIWGTAGNTWTEDRQNELVRYMEKKYGPEWKKDSDAKRDNYFMGAMYGSKWIGHRVADCSGLFKWAFEKLGGSIAHGSNSIWYGYCKEKGQLVNGRRTDGKPLLPGTAIFTDKNGDKNHIGLFVGGGKVIEAQGTANGVIETGIANEKWKNWGELKGVDYQAEMDPGAQQGTPEQTEQTEQEGQGSQDRPTIRKGDRGEWVRKAQEELIRAGYSCGEKGADGIFGDDTMKAVKNFQWDHDLVMDGIVGPKTWEALDAWAAHPPDEEEKKDTYTVTITGLTEEEAALLVRQWPGAEAKKDD